jgi:hypothetical protein
LCRVKILKLFSYQNLIIECFGAQAIWAKQNNRPNSGIKKFGLGQTSSKPLFPLLTSPSHSGEKQADTGNEDTFLRIHHYFCHQ